MLHTSSSLTFVLVNSHTFLKGIDFDRVLCWEIKSYLPKQIFDEIPDEVIGKISYFNVPVEVDISSKMNPLRILKQICKLTAALTLLHSISHEIPKKFIPKGNPEDFVSLKLDIDTENIEISLVKQILNDRELHMLIDEMFFEDHVSKSPMEYRGWGMCIQSLLGLNSAF